MKSDALASGNQANSLNLFICFLSSRIGLARKVSCSCEGKLPLTRDVNAVVKSSVTSIAVTVVIWWRTLSGTAQTYDGSGGLCSSRSQAVDTSCCEQDDTATNAELNSGVDCRPKKP